MTMAERHNHGLMHTTVVLALLLAAVTSTPSTGAEVPHTGAAAQTSPLEEVVVTGSRFARPNDTSPSPVAVMDSKELAQLGTTRAEELLNNLPQVNAGLTLSANGAGVAPLTGTATVDLRGIGAFRTLVLINGRRMNPGDATNPSADLNTIPTALVKRVEVLTGGASSIYGSDAIAGVVNFVMDTGFTGIKFTAEGGLNRGSNDNSALQDIALASGVNPATGGRNDGGSFDLSGVYGVDLFGGLGHLAAYAGYRHTQAVLGSARDFSACTLGETGSSFQCLLDGTTNLGQFAANGGGGPPLTLDPANPGALVPFDQTVAGYNAAPYQYLQRPDTRYNFSAFAQYRPGNGAQAYLEAQYTDDHTSAGYEPSGTTPTGSGLNVFDVNCANPLLSAAQLDAFCTQNGLTLADTAQVGIGRRNFEGGLIQDDFRHRSYRLVLGLKGAVNEAWSYDINANYGNTDSNERLSNDASQVRLANAFKIVNVAGVPTCQSVVDGSDPACAPYNIFAVGGVTQAAARYITASGAQDGYARHAILGATLTGALDKYGIKSSMATEGFGVVAGAEYRTETINNTPNAAYLAGDLTTFGSALVTSGTYNVSELFTELHAPLIQDRPFVKSLTVDLSDRYARYSLQGGVNAYKIGAEWSPVDAVRFRGSLSRAVRAPNGHELFLAQTLSQFPIIDPCAGNLPTQAAAACANTGVTAAQYGNIPAATSINQLTGGNPNVRPETADTFTVGTVLTSASRALVFSADYWRIRVKHYVGSLSAGDSLNNCLATGDPIYCTLVRRDANGSLSVGNGVNAGRVIATRINTGSYENSGIDFDARYALDLAQHNTGIGGKVTFSFMGSLAIDNRIQVVPGTPEFDCTGFYGPTCTGDGPTSPIPTWRHKLRATWEVNKAVELSFNWRHIGQMDSELTSSNPHLSATSYPVDARIPAYEYFDLESGINVGAHASVSLGINNLLDRRPPIIGFNANPLLVNGNMAAGMYDTLGRYLFAGLTIKY